jgi:hypothetical protein
MPMTRCPHPSSKDRNKVTLPPLPFLENILPAAAREGLSTSGPLLDQMFSVDDNIPCSILLDSE